MRRQCKAANAENDVANVEMLTRRSATTIKISGEPKRTPTKRERGRETEEEWDNIIDLEKETFALLPARRRKNSLYVIRFSFL